MLSRILATLLFHYLGRSFIINPLEKVALLLLNKVAIKCCSNFILQGLNVLTEKCVSTLKLLAHWLPPFSYLFEDEITSMFF